MDFILLVLEWLEGLVSLEYDGWLNDSPLEKMRQLIKWGDWLYRFAMWVRHIVAQHKGGKKNETKK